MRLIERLPSEAFADAQSDLTKGCNQRVARVGRCRKSLPHGVAQLIEEADVLRRLAVVKRQQRPWLRRLVREALAQVGRERHQVETLLRFDRLGQVGRAVRKNAHRGHAELGAAFDLGHLAGHIAREVRPGDDIDARLRSLGAADVADDLVKAVADLHDVPARLGQRRHEDHDRFGRHIESGIGVDGDVVGRDDESVLGGLELGILAEIVDVASADLDALRRAAAVVVQRKAPQIRLQADRIGVLLARLFGRHAQAGVRFARKRGLQLNESARRAGYGRERSDCFHDLLSNSFYCAATCSMSGSLHVLSNSGFSGP